MVYRVEHLIDGKVVSLPNSVIIPIHNPATGEVCGEVVLADESTASQAVAAAKAAFPGWAATPAIRRAAVLFQFKQALERDIDHLAEIVTREHGKTLADAKGSITRGIELVDYLCGVPALCQGDYTAGVARGVDCRTIRQPLGVCVAISPFNFPVMVPIWQCVSAIACGNTVVLKPSEQDPSAPLYLAQLLLEAGLPAGVLNVLQGNKAAVDHLLVHPDAMAVAAVASTPVARHIYQTAILHGKRAHTFGGAKNHCVVMPDMDPIEAAGQLLGAAFGSAGERCMAVSVVVAVGDVTADALVAELVKGMQGLRVGDGRIPEVDMGPLISEAHRRRVLAYVDAGVEAGAKLVVDGRGFVCTSAPAGYFMGPCLFDNVTPAMSIYQEEIFGPLLCVLRVPDCESALRLVNEHPMGNGAAILTNSGGAAAAFAEGVEAGMVGVNIPIPVPVVSHPFGGWKQSSFGDLGMQGNQSLQFYTKQKSITTRWPEGATSRAGFAMPTH